MPERSCFIYTELFRHILVTRSEAGKAVGIRVHQCLQLPSCLNESASAIVITACKLTTGHSKTPRNIVATATHAKKIVAPKLKTKRLRTAPRRVPAGFDGKHARPSPISAIPANRAQRTPIPSGAAPYRSWDWTLNARKKLAPTMISSHAAILRTVRGHAALLLRCELKLMPASTGWSGNAFGETVD